MRLRHPNFISTLPNGFTLVELVMVMVITGIIAAMIAVFFKPAIDSYFGSKRRAELTDIADTALRRMARDIRFAVPNSIRSPNNLCFESVPASAGGRYRLAPDSAWDAANPANRSAPIDGATTVGAFDVLSPLSSTPAVGDFVVIDNQNTNDVYAAAVNRIDITSATTPVPNASVARSRITLNGNFSFPPGYVGGRFLIVPSNQGPVFYFCNIPTPSVDAQGTGTGTLYRASGYGFNSATPAACPNAAGAAIVATNVSACLFNYNPASGATQNGFMWMQIQLQQANETVSLSYGTHVDNVP